MLKADYMIAGILISVEAPYELYDSGGYALYRVAGQKTQNVRDSLDYVGESLHQSRVISVSDDIEEHDFEQIEWECHYDILMVEDTDFPLMEGRVLFQNEMNLFLQQGDKTFHFFRIPLTRWTAAWCETTGNRSLTIHFRSAARDYFRESMGCFNAASFEYILFTFGRFLFHCSYVDVGGEAVLFSAHSGGGKTTHALLWEKCGFGEMINGDRAALERLVNRNAECVSEEMQTKDSGFMVHGLPIAGSSNVFKNRSLPLRAIFMLEKAPVNEVVEMAPSRKFLQVFEQMTVHSWDKEFVNATVDFVTELISRVQVKLLRCRPDEGAVQAVREALGMVQE